MQPLTTRPVLEMRGITKRFPGVLALDEVDLTVGRNEVVALIGENGAGKSTLMKILGGIHPPDAGEIVIDGTPLAITCADDATDAGVALIHQELNLADNLTVAENVFLGHEPETGGLLHLFDRKRAETEAARLASQVGLDCPMNTIASTLPPGARQLIEVTKALSLEARILVMDEPTSSLSRRETALLFGVIRRLKARGVSVIYISHRLGEVREVADRAVVHGMVHVLVNNAGWDPRYETTKMTVEQWDHLFALNIRHYFITCRELLPDMIASGSGSIIMTTSHQFWIAFGELACYNSTKGAIIGFVRALAREVGRHNVRVNALAPGWVMTERQLREMITEERKQKLFYEEQILPVALTPEDLAPSYLFLASDASKPITRQTLVVDAGFAMA